MRSRQVSLHTRQVSLPTRRVSLLYVRGFGMDSGAATTPRLDALRGYNDALCSASQKIAVNVVRMLGFRFRKSSYCIVQLLMECRCAGGGVALGVKTGRGG